MVTTAAGISPTALYLQFADLAELVRAVKVRFFSDLAERLHAAVATTDDRLDRLRALAKAYLAHTAERPGHYAVMFHIDKRSDRSIEPPVAVLTAGFEAFQPFQEAVGAVLGKPSTDPEVLEASVELWLSLHGRAHLAAAMPWRALADPETSVDRLVSRMFAL